MLGEWMDVIYFNYQPEHEEEFIGIIAEGLLLIVVESVY